MYYLMPLIFLLMTVFAYCSAEGFYDKSGWFLLSPDLVVLVAAIWIALEASASLSKIKKEQKAEKTKG